MTGLVQNLDTASPKAERRQITVMFCDLADSTAMSERLDPEDLGELLTAYRQVCARSINRYGGFAARYVGDGILVYFGYPHAREHEAEDAVRAGLEIIGNLAEFNDPPLRARIGLATGTVLVGDIVGEGIVEHHAIVGRTPNLASRLQELARPGEIIVADSTHRLLGDLFEYRILGVQTLKGFSAPVHAWCVVGESPVRSQSQAVHQRIHPTPLVGRRDEVDRLARCWREARSGNGQVVLLSGEAGIGKSRLTRHFQDLVQADVSGSAIAKFYCAANYRNSTLHPFVHQIIRAVDIEGSDRNEAAIANIEGYLEGSSIRNRDDIALVLDLLSIEGAARYPLPTLSPEDRKMRTFRMLEAYVGSFARDRPALVIFEDLHWADPTTLELIGRIVRDGLRDLPILLMCTARQEFTPPWLQAPDVTVVSLPRLSAADARELLSRMATDTRLPSQVMAQIVERSDRIPLFLEEVFKAANESFLLDRKSGRAEPSGAASATAVPVSLAGSLMERLDRLGPVKGVAQVASAIGHRFSRVILEAVVTLGRDDLIHALDRLVSSEIIYLQGRGSEAAYVFKHALLRDAAYASVLKGERKRLHARIAEALEEKRPETAIREPELLANHCALGGLAERAIGYWHRAGERARARSANSEAIGHLTHGLELLETLPDDPSKVDREIDLRTSLALAMTALHGAGAPEVKENYVRARLLSETDRESPQHLTIMMGCWTSSIGRSEVYEAQELSRQILELAEGRGETAYLSEAKRISGMSVFYAGQFESARETLESALDLYDPKQCRMRATSYGLDLVVCCEAYLSWAYLFLGDLGEALRRSDAAVAAARRMAHPYSIVIALAFAAFVRQWLEMIDEARELAGKAIAISEDIEFKFFVTQQVLVKDWADARQTGSQGKASAMRQALDSHLAAGPVIDTTHLLGLMGDIYIQTRQAEEARAMLERAVVVASRTGDKYYLAEISRLEAECCLLRREPQAIAEACSHLRRSLEIADRQKAVFWQLRSARSLARLCHDRNRETEAADRLSRLCDAAARDRDTSALIRACHGLIDGLMR